MPKRLSLTRDRSAHRTYSERTLNRMAKSVLTRRIAAALTGLGLMVLCEAQGGGGYLSRTGAPPLRFASALAEHAHFTLPPLAVDKAAESNSERSDASVSPTPTSPNAPSEAPSNSTTSTNEVVAPSAHSEEQSLQTEPTDSTFSPSAASDLLTVTPQMLVEYFTPAAHGTNHSHTAVIVPAAVGFTPPMPKNTPSSQAIYISK